MQPSDLRADSFNEYPPEARQLLTRHIELLRTLPISFLPLFLREAIAYDWKFPAERKELDAQFAFLTSCRPDRRNSLMEPFGSLRIAGDLLNIDWVMSPLDFSERFSAYLWATHQMDAFRAASVEYVEAMNAARAVESLPMPRLSIVVVGRDVQSTAYPLFRKLRPSGVHYTNISAEGGLRAISETLVSRAKKSPIPFGHWYVDGGDKWQEFPAEVNCIAYSSLAPVRTALIEKMIATMKPGGGGPELLRTELAKMSPTEVGLPENGSNAVLSRFELSLLTQGAGTQIFSTTFVQWTARELLRRAQPLTLVARFAPRQREAAVQAIDRRLITDPEGSLIDADMAAYYTWIDQQRLPAANESAFLVWFEDHSQALAPGRA